MKHMVLRCWWLVVLALGACFSPSFDDGAITCGSDELCPPGLSCVGGVCRSSGVPIDAASTMFPLTVTPGGNGAGTVTSTPAGINCGTDCTESYLAGAVVTLAAAPSAGSMFVGWSGACSGTASCTVTLDAAVGVIANFALQDSVVVALAGTGTGFVTSTPAGINCGSDCSEQFAPNTVVVLSALAVTGSTFDGWSGAGCSGTGTCMVTIDSSKMVTATFLRTQHTLTVVAAGNGSGVVRSAPSGIDCGVDCTESVNFDTMITLTATPATGSRFTGWSGGGCTGTSTCMVTITTAVTVTASFTLDTHMVTVTKAGNGAGTVTSMPAGINCGTGADCFKSYDFGTSVTLSATPANGSTFTGWTGGGCTGTATCTVSVTAAASVTATFTLNTYSLTVAKAGNGSGVVQSTPGGIDCGTDCSETYNFGSTVMLAATPTTGTTFVGWSGGGCSGTGACSVTVSAATTVTATFTLTTHRLTVSTIGTGAGTISGVGISCGADCEEIYDFGTVVTLTASPSAGSSFNGWSGGGCSGTGTCVTTITAAVTVSASFTLSTHLLTVSKTGNGSGTVTSSPIGIACGTDCTELYGFGTTVTLMAAPATGSVFGGWSGGICSGVGACEVPINTATTVTATFTLTTHLLTVAPSGNGTGTITSSPAGITCVGDCTEFYNFGTQVTLSATAQAGSIFTGWSGGICTGTGTCDVTMTAATTVTATFILGNNSMTVAKTGTGTGAVTSNPAGINCGADCSEDFANNTVVVLTAAPTTGSIFDGWSGGGCSGTGTCTVTISTAVTVTATFTLTRHTLTVTKDATGNGAGTVTSSPAGINCGADCTEDYNFNTSVTLTAAPASGSTFVGWSGGGCTGTGTCVASMTAATTVTAKFSLIRHKLSVTKPGNGSGGVTATGISCGNDCTEDYDDGTTVTLSATPATGSTFTGWSGACGGTGSCVVTMTAATSVIATFTLTTHQLTVTKVGNTGSGTVDSVSPGGITCGADCTEVYNFGTTVTLVATPANGFTFSGWSGGGCMGTGNCVVTMTAATTVTATFAVATHTLTVNLAGNGSGNVTSSPAGISCGFVPNDCTETYNFNTSVTLTAAPATGSVFSGWSGACTNATGTCVVSMTNALSVTATFTLTTHALLVTKSGTGNGLVTSQPAGINCGAACNKVYDFGTQVMLTATAPAGTSFVGWSGACSGTNACVVTMTNATMADARFDVIPPNIMFVTSMTAAPGSFGGLAGADSACQNLANAANRAGTYVAFLSTTTVDAPSRLAGAQGWVRVDGKPFANTAADIGNGKIYSPPRITELNTDLLSSGIVVTGTTLGGIYSGDGDCNAYTSSSSGGIISSVLSGVTHASSAMMLFYQGADFCSAPRHMYCFGVDRMAVVIPPPSGPRRAFMASWTTPDQGLASADSVCSTAASTAGLAGTYKALLATAGATALSRFNTGSLTRPWFRVDNVAVLPTAAAWAGATYFDAGVNLSADGVTNFHNYLHWSGAASFTTAGTAASTCNNWTDATMTATSGVAGTSDIAFLLGGFGGFGCDATFGVITCLQE